MKLFILTCVALCAQGGELSKLEGPSVCTTAYPTIGKARKQMRLELQQELQEAEKQKRLPEDYKAKSTNRDAEFVIGKPGDGSCWNQVTWEITEIIIP